MCPHLSGIGMDTMIEEEGMMVGGGVKTDGIEMTTD